MADWKDAVVPITNNLSNDTSFGTGFVFHRDASGRGFVMTCRHVVDDLIRRRSGDTEPAALLVAGQAAEIIVQGDEVLDLAVLALEDPSGEPLRLADAAAGPSTDFRAAGYAWMEQDAASLVRRPLTGTLHERNPVTRRFQPGRPPAWYWDLEIDPDLFRELQPGYSGGPVIDVATGRVVAVLNLRRDKRRAHALCIDCRRQLAPALATLIPDLEPSSAPRSAASIAAGASPPGRAAANQGRLDWLAGTIDHQDQVARIEDSGTPVSDRSQGPMIRYCIVDACRDDCPRALAVHAAARAGGFGQELLGRAELITEVVPAYYGEHGIWGELVAILADAGVTLGRSDEDELVLDWINRPQGAKGSRVLYAELDLRYRRGIPQLIRGTLDRFAGLSGIDPRVRLLFLFALVRARRTWCDRLGWRSGGRLAAAVGCDHLGSLCPVTLLDLDAWLQRLEIGPVRIDAETRWGLRAALEPLFQPSQPGVRYRSLWDRAVPLLRGATPVLDPRAS